MRILIYLLCSFLFILVSCTTRVTKRDIIKKEADSYLTSGKHKLKNYEFVDFGMIDSLTISESLDAKSQEIEYEIEKYELLISMSEQMQGKVDYHNLIIIIT